MRKFYLLILTAFFLSSATQAQTPDTHLSYDGSFNYLTMPNNIVQGLNGSFTLEAFVYWRGGSPTWGNSLLWQRVFDFGTGQNNYTFLTPQSNLNSRSGVMFAITVGDPMNYQVIQSDNPLPQNVWTHIAITVDAATNTGHLFINGILDPTATNTSFTFRPSDLGPTTNNWLGRSEFAGSPNFDPYFNGEIDEFRISNVVRYTADFTPSLIQFTPDANTVALYHFNEGSGQTTADATTNFADAILGTDLTIDPVTDPTWAFLSPLPVRILDFTATANQANRTVDIRWTAGMDASTEFVLERSSNGSHFTPIYTLNRSGGTSGTETFSFRDVNPVGGRNYYRLKCSETGSPTVYSRILPVSFASRQTLVIYPNPVKGTGINLELVEPFTGEIQLNIYNTAGITVYRKIISSVRQREFRLNNTSSMPPGTYMVEMLMDGQKQTRLMVIR